MTNDANQTVFTLPEFDPDTLIPQSMLIRFSAGMWNANKTDAETSSDVEARAGTRAKAGKYTKDLMAGTTKLAEVRSVYSATKQYLRRVAQGWGDNGDRRLSVMQVPEVESSMQAFEAQFKTKVNEFLGEYDELVRQAMFALNGLARREDYPTRAEVEASFYFRYSFAPMPQMSGFSHLSPDIRDRLIKEYKDLAQASVKSCMDEAWQRVFDTLRHMADRLADKDEKGGRKKIYDTTLSNARELCGLLKSFNIAQDVKLEQMRIELSRLLDPIDTDMIKSSDEVRRSTKSKVDALLDKFSV